MNASKIKTFTDRYGNTLRIDDFVKSIDEDSANQATVPPDKSVSRLVLFFIEKNIYDSDKTHSSINVPFYKAESETDADNFVNDLGRIVENDALTNLDVNDIKTIAGPDRGNILLYVTGVSVEGSMKEAIDRAVACARQHNYDLFMSRKMIVAISLNGSLTMSQMHPLDAFLAKFTGEFEYKWGLTKDNALPDGAVKVVILANMGDLSKK